MLHQDWPRDSGIRQIPDSRSNVWCVGNIILCLMRGQEFERAWGGYEGRKPPEKEKKRKGRADWLNLKPGDTRKHLAYTEEEKEHYKKPLRHLVTECLQFEPTDRPTFDEIMEYFEVYTGTGMIKDRSRGLRRAPTSSSRWNKYMLKAHVDKYAKSMWLTKVLSKSQSARSKDGPKRAMPPKLPKDDDALNNSSEDSDSDDLGGRPGKAIRMHPSGHEPEDIEDDEDEPTPPLDQTRKRKRTIVDDAVRKIGLGHKLDRERK